MSSLRAYLNNKLKIPSVNIMNPINFDDFDDLENLELICECINDSKYYYISQNKEFFFILDKKISEIKNIKNIKEIKGIKYINEKLFFKTQQLLPSKKEQFPNNKIFSRKNSEKPSETESSKNNPIIKKYLERIDKYLGNKAYTREKTNEVIEKIKSKYQDIIQRKYIELSSCKNSPDKINDELKKIIDVVMLNELYQKP